MTNGTLSRWTRALGAAVLVVAVLPLAAGPASADGSSNNGSDKAAERCLEKDNERGKDCPAPESAAPVNPTAGAPAPAEQAREQAPASTTGAPAAASGEPAEAAKDNGKPAEAAAKDNGKPAEAAKDNGKPASQSGKADAPKTYGRKADAPKTYGPKAVAPRAPTVAPPSAKDNGKKPGTGHTPVNVCHATSSDSNPYVFITVDDDSVKAEGHLAHRNEPNKTWKSAGTFRGVEHAAGDAKPDLIDGLDGVIDEASDCADSVTPPPPPPPPTPVAATGSFDIVCTPTAGRATVGTLSTGTTQGSFQLVYGATSTPVVSGSVVDVPAEADIELRFVPTSGAAKRIDGKRSPSACPLTVTPPPTAELTKTSVPPSGSVVTAGQTIDYTVTVVNTGQVAITNAPVVDTLPDFVTVVSGSVSVGGTVSADERTITWTATLAPGAGATYTYQGVVAANAPTGRSLVNKVTFLLMERTTTHAVGDRSLEIRKAASAAVAQFGDELTYTLTVRALGTLGQTKLVVRDGIPAGTTYVSGSAACDASPCMESFNNNEVTWTLGDLAPGATRTVTFRVTVDTPRTTTDSGIPAVTIRNVGLAFSKEVPPTPSNEVVTDVVAVGGVKSGPNGPGGSNGPDGPDGGSGGGPNPDDDVLVSPTSGGPLAQTGAGLPFGAVLLFGGLLLLAGIALIRLGWSTRGTPGALG